MLTYVLERYAQPTLHDPSLGGQKKRDFINCLDVPEQLIGSFYFQQRSGRPKMNTDPLYASEIQ